VRRNGEPTEEAHEAVNRQSRPPCSHVCCSQVQTAEVTAVKTKSMVGKDQATEVERPKQNGARRANGFVLIGVHAVKEEVEESE